MQRLTAALLAPTLLASMVQDDTVQLRFAPAPGVEVSHDLKVERTTSGSDLSVKMNGDEVPSQFLPKMAYEFTTTTSLTLTDSFLKAEEGIDGPWRSRTLGAIGESFAMEMDVSGEGTAIDAEASSDLEDEAFLIGRDEDGEVVVRWADEDNNTDEELLVDALPDVDLAGLLPEEAVTTGSTWDGDAAALGDVLGLGGTLPWTWSGVPESQIPAPSSNVWSGELTLRVVDVRAEEGVVLVTISFQGEVIETSVSASDLSQVPVADGTATDTTTLTYAAKGEFTWNATAHHLASFHIEGEGEGEMVTEKDAGQPGPSYSSAIQLMAKLEAHFE